MIINNSGIEAKGPGGSSLQSTEVPSQRMRRGTFYYTDSSLLTNLRFISQTKIPGYVILLILVMYRLRTTVPHNYEGQYCTQLEATLNLQ